MLLLLLLLLLASSIRSVHNLQLQVDCMTEDIVQDTPVDFRSVRWSIRRRQVQLPRVCLLAFLVGRPLAASLQAASQRKLPVSMRRKLWSAAVNVRLVVV